jgi:hypothetical protein
MHDETALAEAEVEYENHTSPHLGEVPLLDDPAKIDRRARRQESQHHHLDDDSLDAARVHGGGVRIPMKSMSRSNPATKSTSLPPNSRKTDRREVRPGDPRELASFPGANLSA